MPTCANWVKWVLINMLYNKCIQLLLQNRYKRGLQEYKLNHICYIKPVLRIIYKTQSANTCLPHICVEYLRQHNWIGLIRKTDQPDKPVFGDIIITIVISDLSRQHCLFGDSHVGSSLLIF
jgi:hypothetical protein